MVDRTELVRLETYCLFLFCVAWTIPVAAVPYDWDSSGFINSHDLFILSELWGRNETPYGETPYGETPYGAEHLLELYESWHESILTDVEHLPSVVQVPAGKFLMGNLRKGADRSHASYSWCAQREFPLHWVYLDKYEIGQYEVTIEEYAEFLNDGNDSHWYSDMALTNYCGLSRTGSPGQYTYVPSSGRGKYPIVFVTWCDALAYCNWLGDKTGQPYRLPTEAEWEKAARWDGVNETAYIYPWGDIFDSARLNSWASSTEHLPKPVGSYPSGAHTWPQGSVYDMAGNVWEYVADVFAADYYSRAPEEIWDNPKGPASGLSRVIRGGSWAYMAYQLNSNDGRCAARHFTYRSYRHTNVGFRVAKGP